MSDNIFVDTNIFVYGYTDKEKEKMDYIHEYWKTHLADKKIFVSTQILSEFYSAMTKQKVSHAIIKEKMAEIIQTTTVTPLSLPTIEHCFALKEKYAYSWWDSLVLASALESECGEVCSEDMQDGQVIEGSLTISNPFYRK